MKSPSVAAMRVHAIVIVTWSLLLVPCLGTTVVTWNVWNGFDGGRTRGAAADWLAARRPDIVALEELNGQTPESLAALANRWGHPYSAILKREGYPVGITSRQPIEVVARHRKGLGHGCLQVRTAGFEVFVVHLHPGDRAIRLREMKLLTALIAPLLDAGKQVLVLGDFNAHSPADRKFLSGQTLLLERRKGPNLHDGGFDFEVVGGFLKGGLRDPSAMAAPSNRTFPTRILEHVRTPESQAAFLERIDFILTDPATAATCRGVEYPDDEELDTISDHYPVIARFGTKDEKGDQ